MAVICVQVLGTQWACKRTAKPLSSMQNCLFVTKKKAHKTIPLKIGLMAREFSLKSFSCRFHQEILNGRLYLKCSYFQTPSSCDSGIVSIASIFDGSFLISCWMYCCTANVLSISSNGSSVHRQKSLKWCRKIVGNYWKVHNRNRSIGPWQGLCCAIQVGSIKCTHLVLWFRFRTICNNTNKSNKVFYAMPNVNVSWSHSSQLSNSTEVYSSL